MQMEFVSTLTYFDGGYEWYDSDDYSMLLIGFAGKNRPKSPEAQRRLRCAGSVEEIEHERFREFNPFKSAPSMFYEFSELDGSEESVLEFTNRYGRLWGDFHGPSLADYRDALEDLGDAMRLWGAVQSRDESGMREFAAWDSAGRLRWKSVLARPIDHGTEVIHFIDVKHGRRNYKRGDLLTPCTDLLDFVISSRPTWGHGIKPARRNDVISLQLQVDGLLQVIWVQFALAVAENKTYGQCQHCDRPYELAPQVNRADRLFCSDNCRVKAYQRRKKQALELSQQGKSPQAIARETQSDLQSVKKWISEAKEPSNGKETKRKR